VCVCVCIVRLDILSPVLMCLDMIESQGAFEVAWYIYYTASDKTAKTGVCLCVCLYACVLY